MEFKSEDGTLSKLQRVMLDDLEADGYKVAVPRSVDEAKRILLSYLGEDQ